MSGDQPGSMVAVVDDDPRSLESLESLLESAGYAVRLFRSATALLESVDLVQVDCLISDICMPVMNGFELLQAVKALRPELPVILITGRIELIGQLSAGSPGHGGIFEKPFNGHDLLSAVGRVLQGKRAQ